MSDKLENNAVSSHPIEINDNKKQNLDKFGRSYATGRRKESVSRVWIKAGSGKIQVNGKSSDKYFSRDILRMILEEPLKKTDKFTNVEIYSTVKGGGLSGQAGALRHGISRALVEFEPKLREKLKKLGFLTRDSRKVERKKFGRHKARRRPQFSKR